jgi:DNA-binding GntR family transcriptional regulator
MRSETSLKIPGVNNPQGRVVKSNVLNSIKIDIISQNLKPGQLVHEDELASKYGISRTPIREILRMLEYEDLVKIVPKVGTFISELTAKDIEEVLEIRISLEPAAAKAAAFKATDEQLGEFREIDRQLTIAIEKQDSVISFEADRRLHDLILITAGNERSRRIINSLMGQIYRIRFISRHKPGRIETTVAEHKTIVSAIVNKLPEEAEKAMRSHLANTWKLLLPSSDMEAQFQSLVRRSVNLDQRSDRGLL